MPLLKAVISQGSSCDNHLEISSVNHGSLEYKLSEGWAETRFVFYYEHLNKGHLAVIRVKCIYPSPQHRISLKPKFPANQ